MFFNSVIPRLDIFEITHRKCALILHGLPHFSMIVKTWLCCAAQVRLEVEAVRTAFAIQRRLALVAAISFALPQPSRAAHSTVLVTLQMVRSSSDNRLIAFLEKR